MDPSDSLDCDLPDFDNPPVVETVLSAQFERLPAMRLVHFGLFWQRIRDQFPKTEEHPTLASIVEQATPRPVEMRFELQETLLLPRLWLLNSVGTEMMQIQNDRFIKNWRKCDENEEYPRYAKTVKPAFERDFDCKIWEYFHRCLSPPFWPIVRGRSNRRWVMHFGMKLADEKGFYLNEH